MNRKRIWPILPAALLPYLVLCASATIFFSTKNPLSGFIMDSIFSGNALYLLAALLILCAIAAIFSAMGFISDIRQRRDALSLAKIAMIVKLIHAPAYVAIFVLGIALAITLFTIPFSIGLFLLDCFCLFLTGLLTASAVINAAHKDVITRRESIWILASQLIFCVDVAAAIIFYCMLRKRPQTEQ